MWIVRTVAGLEPVAAGSAGNRKSEIAYSEGLAPAGRSRR